MRTVRFGDVIDVDRAIASGDDCRTMPYVGLEHIDKDAGRFSDDFRPKPANVLATKFRFTHDHVLYGKLRPYLNKVALPYFHGVCTTEILPLLPKPGKLERGFLYAVLLSPRFVNWASQNVSGANLPRIGPDRLLEYEFDLPDLAEQKRIAAIFERADRLRRLRRYAVYSLDGLVQSSFLKQFGDPKSNEKNWKHETLADLCIKFSDGPFGSNLKSQHYKPEGIRVVRLQNIGIGTFLDDDRAFISMEHFAGLRKHECSPGDVLIGTLGDPNLRACIQPKSLPVALNKADCVQARPDPNKITGEYLCWLLNMPSTLLLAPGLVHGQTRSRVSMGQLAAIVLPVPPLPDQSDFSRIVRRIEALQAKNRESLRQAEHLFQTLLHRAFTSGL
jgi:type I restriction enzyme, S subunit